MSEVYVAQARRTLIKSCAQEVFGPGQEYRINHSGPVNQRQWMVVDAMNKFLTQRPKGMERMALIQPHLEGDTLVINAPGTDEIEIPFDAQEGNAFSAEIWGDEVLVSEDPNGSQWMSDYLHADVKLVKQKGCRLINRPTVAPDATVGFSDRYPLTIISMETIRRFSNLLGKTVDPGDLRPDIVLEGCSMSHEENTYAELQIGSYIGRGVKPGERCQMTDVDQSTGERGTGLFNMLKREFKGSKGVPIAAENFDVQYPGSFTVGAKVHILERRKEGWDREY